MVDQQIALAVETVPIDSLRPHSRNYRGHPEDQLEHIVESIREHGFYRNVVIARDGTILAGHGVVEAVQSMGGTEVPVVRLDLDPDEPRALKVLVGDNQIALLGGIDDQALGQMLKEIRDTDLDGLLGTGYDEMMLDTLLSGIGALDAAGGAVAEDPGAQIDRAEELREKWQTERGQLWLIGKHRLLCGDSTSAEDVASLMDGERAQGAFTSPPYGEQRKRNYGGTPADEYVAWWDAVQVAVRGALVPDGSFFVNIKPHCDAGERTLYVMDLVLAMRRRWDWRYIDELCWLGKAFPGLMGPRFKNGFEPVYHFAAGSSVKFRPENVLIDKDMTGWQTYDETGGGVTMATGRVVGGRVRSKHFEGALPSNVIDVKQGAGSPAHEAVFPVGLPEFFLNAYSDAGDLWYEPFAGAGTTLVAAEQTGRHCYGMEIEPKYVAVALERLAQMGLEPRRG